MGCLSRGSETAARCRFHLVDWAQSTSWIGPGVHLDAKDPSSSPSISACTSGFFLRPLSSISNRLAHQQTPGARGAARPATQRGSPGPGPGPPPTPSCVRLGRAGVLCHPRTRVRVSSLHEQSRQGIPRSLRAQRAFPAAMAGHWRHVLDSVGQAAATSARNGSAVT